MTQTELQKLVDTTVRRANDLVEQFTGTIAGSIINSKKNHLEDLVKQNEMNLASIAVLELVEACDGVEHIDDEY